MSTPFPAEGGAGSEEGMPASLTFTAEGRSHRAARKHAVEISDE